MAPTIIVGDDESAGDVAAQLLKLADRERDVKTRTDLSRPAFTVPDELYDRYTNGDRSETERRVNAVEELSAADDADTQVTTEDEIPASAVNADPRDVAGVGAPIEGDDIPAGAVNADPPGTAPADQTNPGQDDAGQDDQPAKKAAPRKRAPARKATKSTPADAGDAK